MTEQETLDRMLLIAAWEIIFGGGELSTWQRVVARLLAFGATMNGKQLR